MGSHRVASDSGPPEAYGGVFPSRMSASSRGVSLYLSCCCLMYTHLLYLLPNKRNTSVLPTETVPALAPRSPGAWRRSKLLRAAEPGTVGTLVSCEVLEHRSMRVRGAVASSASSTRWLGRKQTCQGIFRFAPQNWERPPSSLPILSQGSPQLALAWGHWRKPVDQGHLEQSVYALAISAILNIFGWSDY